MNKRVLVVVLAMLLVIAAAGSLSSITGCSERIPFLAISPQNLEISIGEIQYFTATYYAPDGTSICVTPSWEVKNNIGTIDATGLLTVTSIGTGEVAANYNGLYATTKVYASDMNYILGKLCVKFTENISVDELTVSTNSISINALLEKYEAYNIEKSFQNTDDPALSRIYTIHLSRPFNIRIVVNDFLENPGIIDASPFHQAEVF